ncbi:hypothetical protein [Hymenobacter yonginensis]|uniref:Uncharacterized protein n=1 Tax=Hymenobacter yonginensis TaxID=748197 RepID=A0ABY7PKN2_9BACT|nr:hypothetical protein [Hymenobacter yonginensis]WBO83234.1 hypothetical protein O9Z63_12680 [Hymenobacter yonginensis]
MTTMRILPDDFPKSGYQLRPPAPPSAGRALSVLIAVCAVLWVMLILPSWYLSGTGDWQSYNDLLGIACYALAAAPLWSSYIVWRWATGPMWLAEPMQIEFKRGLVLALCLVFHLVMIVAGFFLALLLVSVLS